MFSACCLRRKVTKHGMHRKEVTAVRLSVLTLFPFFFFPLLFPAPSLSDKAERDDGAMNNWRPWGGGYGCECTCVRACMLREG